MSVKHEQVQNCGGAYIRLLGDIDQSNFSGKTPYQIMFGPDICRPKRTIGADYYSFKYGWSAGAEPDRSEPDHLTHLYTLIVKPDNTFEVLIDLESVKTGSLCDAGDFLMPPKIVTSSVDAVVKVDVNFPRSGSILDRLRKDDVISHIGFELWQSSAGTLFDDIIVTDNLEEATAYAQETFLKKQGPEKEAYEVYKARPRSVAGTVTLAG